MAGKVNLDALIPREDFDITDPSRPVGTRKLTLSANDLKYHEFFHSVLRKPDFQRETSEWSSNKVIDFIESFLTGELIPAVILWQNPSYTFVIDGAHRLSALAAWINDDYGDGDISKEFYESIIPEEQLDIAVKTRIVVNKKLGSYKDHVLALQSPIKAKPEVQDRARQLGTLAIALQYVEGDANKAENSFIKINQNPSTIDATELKVIQARRKPIGIAARAIARAGKGHKYWSKFTPSNIEQLEQLSKEVNQLLFQPKLPHGPLKTLDLPMAGEAYAAQSLPLILEFIELINRSTPTIGEVDTDGIKTITCLNKCKKLAEMIDSSDPGSLGLHPAVYFYAPNGRHKVASFLAIASLLLDFKKSDFPRFTSVRGLFETLLIQYDYLIQQIVRQRRGATAGIPVIKEFYIACITALASGKTVENTIDEVLKSGQFGKLTTEYDETADIGDFSKGAKSQVFLREALKSAMKCPICHGYLHLNAMSVDHIVRVEDGGSSSTYNGQITHPYCNTGYKEMLNAKGTQI
jgi:hypothetical protein